MEIAEEQYQQVARLFSGSAAERQADQLGSSQRRPPSGGAGLPRAGTAGTLRPLAHRFFIADSQQQAIDQARPYFEEAMKFAAPLGLMRLSQEQIDSVAQGGRPRGVALPTLEEAVANKVWLCGPPEQIADHLMQVEDKYPGVERVNLGAVMGMPAAVFKDQLTRFAEGVIPILQNR